MARLALIYDALVRPDTTGIWCDRALRLLGHEVHHYAPLASDGRGGLVFLGYQTLPSDYELYLQIDDDLSYPGPVAFHPNAYWCIDTHRLDQMVGGWSRRRKAEGFDRLFTAQLDGVDVLGGSWLPLACDPSIHRPLPEVVHEFDWCFVGSTEFALRRELLTRLMARFPRHFVGRAYGEDLVSIFNRSRLILNISVGKDVNMRCFEAQACGGLLLTNRVDNGEDQLFSHLVTYATAEELEEVFSYFLGHDAERTALAARQCEETRRRHSYQQRMSELLAACGVT
ncbi:MAG: hypothetical protein A2284_17935 [Deltaproteobacteria bacterium RIFOXYA12_FULL_61_11]|nr:MAG: hypothetical protein A2284_17935 [Deltaproteobacteria bacterium RIFOXYA12_FULL_61_11]